MSLHPKCEQRLIEELSNGLASVRVEHGHCIDYRTALICCDKVEVVLPQAGKQKDSVKKNLERCIGELPIYHFVTDKLSKLLEEKFDYSSEANPQKLSSLPGYENPLEIAQNLIKNLKMLPWEYDLTFELPEKLSDQFAKCFNEFVVTPQLRIVVPDAQFESLYPLDTGDPKKN